MLFQPPLKPKTAAADDIESMLEDLVANPKEKQKSRTTTTTTSTAKLLKPKVAKPAPAHSSTFNSASPPKVDTEKVTITCYFNDCVVSSSLYPRRWSWTNSRNHLKHNLKQGQAERPQLTYLTPKLAPLLPLLAAIIVTTPPLYQIPLTLLYLSFPPLLGGHFLKIVSLFVCLFVCFITLFLCNSFDEPRPPICQTHSSMTLNFQNSPLFR